MVRVFYHSLLPVSSHPHNRTDHLPQQPDIVTC